MRRVYLDNIRWATVLLVMLYHVFYMFNAVGVLGGVGGFREVQYQDGLLYFVYPWFMELLFVIAGMSARYALEKRTAKEFLKSRTGKLLVPSTLGLFVYQWIVGYFNIRISGGLEYMPGFLVYPVSVLSGIGPLWFAQLLWLFSLLLLLIRKLDRDDKIWKLGKRCRFPALLSFALLLWGASQILNMPVITVYRFGIYLTAFLLGYFVLSHDEVQERLEKAGPPMLVFSVFLGIAYTVFYFGENYAEAPVLKSFFTNGYAWFMVLAILGCGRKWFQGQGRFGAYMTGVGYGFYILHYTFVCIPCYYLKNETALPAWSIYLLALLAVSVGTPVLYGILRRIPVVRRLVLGIDRKGPGKRGGGGAVGVAV